MTWDLLPLLARRPISGPTINSVYLPPPFRTLIYALILSVLIISAAYFFMKEDSFRVAIKKAVAAAFLVSGFTYAVQADLGWAAWLKRDLENLGGLNMDEKLVRIDGYGHMYDVVRSARGILHPEYMLLTGDDYVRLRVEYLLLPLRKREKAGDILVLEDPSVHYDQAARTLTKGTLRITGVEPIFIHSRDIYVLRKK